MGGQGEGLDDNGGAPETLLSVRDITKRYGGNLGLRRRSASTAYAVDGVSFDLKRGTALALVGESGGGKTTLGRLVAGLENPTDGGVYADGLLKVKDGPPAQGTPVHRLSGKVAKQFRRSCQFVPQNAAGSLNRRRTIRETLSRPLQKLGVEGGVDMEVQLVAALERVGLNRQHLDSVPEFFSTGQLQRIAIARALALNPEIVVLDEPTTPVDVSSQAHILNLLVELQKQMDLTYVIITHDLAAAQHVADEILVIRAGKVVDRGPTDLLLRQPGHPYTQRLIDSDPYFSMDSD